MNPEFKEHPEDYEIIEQSVDFEDGQETCLVRRKGEKDDSTPEQKEKTIELIEKLKVMSKISENFLKAFAGMDSQSACLRLMILKKQIEATLEDAKIDEPKEYNFFDKLSRGLIIIGKHHGKELLKNMKNKKGVKNGKQKNNR